MDVCDQSGDYRGSSVLVWLHCWKELWLYLLLWDTFWSLCFCIHITIYLNLRVIWRRWHWLVVASDPSALGAFRSRRVQCAAAEAGKRTPFRPMREKLSVPGQHDDQRPALRHDRSLKKQGILKQGTTLILALGESVQGRLSCPRAVLYNTEQHTPIKGMIVRHWPFDSTL